MFFGGSMARVKKFKSPFSEEYNWQMACEDGIIVNLTDYKDKHSFKVQSSIIFPVAITREAWEKFIRPSDETRRTNTINYILESVSYLLGQDNVRGEFVTRIDMKKMKIKTANLYVNTIPGGFKFPNVIIIMLPEES
jgi:hypothetical protein